MEVEFKELIKDNGKIIDVLFECNEVGIRLLEYSFIELRFPNKCMDYYMTEVIERIRANKTGWMDNESKEAFEKASEIKRIVLIILNGVLNGKSSSI